MGPNVVGALKIEVRMNKESYTYVFHTWGPDAYDNLVQNEYMVYTKKCLRV